MRPGQAVAVPIDAQSVLSFKLHADPLRIGAGSHQEIELYARRAADEIGGATVGA